MIEKAYKVYFKNEGAKLVVAPDDDGLDMVQVGTTDKHSEEYFGPTRLVLDPAFARELAKAILMCADDCDKNQKDLQSA